MPSHPPRDRLADRLSRLHFKPLLFSQLDLLYGPLRLHRLELHRHLHLSPNLKPHDHRFGQILLYLTGRGHLQIGSLNATIRPGTLAAAPAGLPHSFQRTSSRPPLSLTLEGNFPDLSPAITTTPGSTLYRLRELLHRLATLRDAPHLAPRTESAGLCLQILGLLLATLHPPPTPALPRHGQALAPRLARLLQTPGMAALPIAQLALRLGYHPDYLNRRLKLETGQTFRQLRDIARLRLASDSLAKGTEIEQIATLVGFRCPAHFARWFHQHHGYTPAAHRRRLRQLPTPTPQIPSP
ncbi:MAG: AraC family transcriptional regulator [Verrucomicrobiia bacterium]